jgi:hypothetical protein
MAAKLLLSISADQATAAIWQRRKLSSIRQFASDDSGWSEFASYVRAAKGAPARIIVDTIDEDYRFETLPRASGGDRSQMVARKIRQLYRSTPYAAATLQERSTGRRGDDRYLFAALTSPEIISPWLRILQQSRTPIAGVHLLPMTTLALLDRMKLKQANVLLVAKSGAGLRQTFCKHSKFRISRLTPLRGLSAPADQFYAEEIGNTRMYLDALTVTHVDDSVSVVILDPDGSLAGLPAAIASGRPNLKPQIFGPAEIESQLGIPATELRQSADVLHLRLLASSPRLTDLAPPVVESGFRIYRVRQMIYAAAAACTIGSLVWAGVDLIRTQRTGASTLALQNETRKFEAMYREVTAQFPKAPASALEMREAVDAAEHLRAQLRTPQAMFSVIGGAMEKSPNISLSRIEWRIAKGAPAGNPGQGRGTPAPVSSTQGLLQTGVVTAEVNDYDGNYRTAIGRIQDFVRRLAENEQVAEVSVLELPVDISSSTGLTGDTSATASSKGAVFRVAVSFQPGA